MKLEEIQAFFHTSPSASLMRAKSAPFVIDFLHSHFKRKNRITVRTSTLTAELREYQEQLAEAWPDALPKPAAEYLSDWCKDETRYLQRFYSNEADEPLFQLTPSTEEVLQFLDKCLRNDLGFVGTESRIRMMLDTLEEIVVQASDDPEERLRHLESEKRRIETEMALIRERGSVERLQAAQVRERFGFALALLKGLLGDFRTVEESFKNITREVQQRQLEDGTSRGGVLEYALDCEDVLKTEDQGVSFYEFVRLILSPQRQEQLESLIARIRQLEELASQRDGLDSLSSMMPMLLAEAEKIMATNQRLTSTLRRLLDVDAARDKRRLRGLLQEIKSLAARCAESPPGADFAIETDGSVEISNAFAREFWGPPQTFEALAATESEGDPRQREQAFRQLAELARLDWRGMRDNIQRLTRERGAVDLGTLLESHPPLSGPVEVIGYVQIAKDDGHRVSEDEVQEIAVGAAGQGGKAARLLQVPRVVFLAEAAAATL